MKHLNHRLLLGAVALSLGAVSVVMPAAQAAPKVATAQEVWPGRRLVLLLPLQLSDNWNADVRWGQTLLSPAEAQLRKALENTGKFSVVQPYRFDPILQRALLDKRIAKDQIEDLVTNPSLQTASPILANLGFDLQPMIADFRLEEVRASGPEKTPNIQVQVLGKLYPLNSQEAEQTKVFTSDPIRYRSSQYATVLGAAGNAFQMVASEFVKPITEAVLPRVEPPPGDEKADGKMDKGAKPKMPAPKTPAPNTTPDAAPPAIAPPSTAQPAPPANAPANPATPSNTAAVPPAASAASGTASMAAGASSNATESPDEKRRIFINPLNRGQLTRNP